VRSSSAELLYSSWWSWSWRAFCRSWRTCGDGEPHALRRRADLAAPTEPGRWSYPYSYPGISSSAGRGTNPNPGNHSPVVFGSSMPVTWWSATGRGPWPTSTGTPLNGAPPADAPPSAFSPRCKQPGANIGGYMFLYRPILRGELPKI
jgi:hypothetical protein